MGVTRGLRPTTCWWAFVSLLSAATVGHSAFAFSDAFFTASAITNGLDAARRSDEGSRDGAKIPPAQYDGSGARPAGTPAEAGNVESSAAGNAEAPGAATPDGQGTAPGAPQAIAGTPSSGARGLSGGAAAQANAASTETIVSELGKQLDDARRKLARETGVESRHGDPDASATTGGNDVASRPRAPAPPVFGVPRLGFLANVSGRPRDGRTPRAELARAEMSASSSTETAAEPRREGPRSVTRNGSTVRSTVSASGRKAAPADLAPTLLPKGMLERMAQMDELVAQREDASVGAKDRPLRVTAGTAGGGPGSGARVRKDAERAGLGASLAGVWERWARKKRPSLVRASERRAGIVPGTPLEPMEGHLSELAHRLAEARHPRRGASAWTPALTAGTMAGMLAALLLALVAARARGARARGQES